MNIDLEKKLAAVAAANYIENDMRLGLGTGSTAIHFIDIVSEKIKQGMKILAVPSSQATKRYAESLGIELAELNEIGGRLDLTVDGADELNDELIIIKGGGGALWREKILASISDKVIIIADSSKHVKKLGKFPLAVEVTPFSHAVSAHQIADICGVEPILRFQGQTPFVSDGKNYIYDCPMGQIEDAALLAKSLDSLVGVVAHGLFIDLADRVFLGSGEATILLKK